jgi:3-deoxy-manno-octulosonate cytidylyltransferase (CMP-KDO synthetase)
VRTAIVIPARYSAQRLPAKPLLRTTGKYLIQHVYERACESQVADDVIVATDDPRIATAVNAFGGRCVLTRRDHLSGTDRVAEVARKLDVDVVLNLQGDEPEIDPSSLKMLPKLLIENPRVDIATVAVPIRNIRQWLNPNNVKVVCDAQGQAMYFSRAPVPYEREGRPDFSAEPSRYLHHQGIYAYRRDILLQLAKLAPHPLEKVERLEQLRWLANGFRICVGITSHAGCGVDTLDEYDAFVRRYRRRRTALAA